jgi:hypothetical protein
MMVRLGCHQSLRQTEGRLGSLLDLMGLDLPVPDDTTWGNRLSVAGVNDPLYHPKEWF